VVAHAIISVLGTLRQEDCAVIVLFVFKALLLLKYNRCTIHCTYLSVQFLGSGIRTQRLTHAGQVLRRVPTPRGVYVNELIKYIF
jgi:hypothetical protein